MILHKAKYRNLLLRKGVIILLITATALGAFASLGDGKGKAKEKNKSVLSSQKIDTRNRTISLKSGYHYRGSQIFNRQIDDNCIMLNTTITLHKGNTTYILPLKRKVILNKIKFNLYGNSNIY